MFAAVCVRVLCFRTGRQAQGRLSTVFFSESLRSLSETMLEIMALMSSATTFDCKTNAFGAGMHFFLESFYIFVL